MFHDNIFLSMKSTDNGSSIFTISSNETCSFFGITQFIADFLTMVSLEDDIKDALKVSKKTPGLNFDEDAMYEYLRLNRQSRVPIEIWAQHEGSLVPGNEPLVVVKTTNPQFNWLVNVFGNLAMRYLSVCSSAATKAFNLKQAYLIYLSTTCPKFERLQSEGMPRAPHEQLASEAFKECPVYNSGLWHQSGHKGASYMLHWDITGNLQSLHVCNELHGGCKDTAFEFFDMADSTLLYNLDDFNDAWELLAVNCGQVTNELGYQTILTEHMLNYRVSSEEEIFRVLDNLRDNGRDTSIVSFVLNYTDDFNLSLYSSTQDADPIHMNKLYDGQICGPLTMRGMDHARKIARRNKQQKVVVE